MAQPGKFEAFWMLRRTLVANGIFSADHIKMKMPEDDVKLTNGSGYMVEEQQFKNILPM
jgi:hypothetical protein